MRPTTALPAILILPLLTLAAPDPAATHSAKLDGIKIGHAWAPPAEGDGGAVYMPIANDRDGDVTLTDARTPIAAEVYLRTGKGANAKRLETLTLQPGQPLALAAWRAHLWTAGLNRTLKEGDRFPLTLTFEPGGEIEIEVIVESVPGH